LISGSGSVCVKKIQILAGSGSTTLLRRNNMLFPREIKKLLYPLAKYYPLATYSLSSGENFTIFWRNTHCPLAKYSLPSVEIFTFLWRNIHYLLAKYSLSSGDIFLSSGEIFSISLEKYSIHYPLVNYIFTILC
jgi:hypothetical protein